MPAPMWSARAWNISHCNRGVLRQGARSRLPGGTMSAASRSSEGLAEKSRRKLILSVGASYNVGRNRRVELMRLLTSRNRFYTSHRRLRRYRHAEERPVIERNISGRHRATGPQWKSATGRNPGRLRDITASIWRLAAARPGRGRSSAAPIRVTTGRRCVRGPSRNPRSCAPTRCSRLRSSSPRARGPIELPAGTNIVIRMIDGVDSRNRSRGPDLRRQPG